MVMLYTTLDSMSLQKAAKGLPCNRSAAKRAKHSRQPQMARIYCYNKQDARLTD